jgi:antitoxin (DNA-binding transcriptional repressor) of toxin-antitoxin stability system
VESVNIHYAKTNLSRLIERVQLGEEIVISKAGKPVVKFSALDAGRKPRVLGLLKGRLKLSADFDAPLPEEILGAFSGH